MADPKPVVAPAPRPLPNRPQVDPVARAEIDRQRQAHIDATVPRHKGERDPADPSTMTLDELVAHILAGVRRELEAMPLEELRVGLMEMRIQRAAQREAGDEGLTEDEEALARSEASALFAGAVGEDLPNLGLATNLELREELAAREATGHTADDYRTVDPENPGAGADQGPGATQVAGAGSNGAGGQESNLHAHGSEDPAANQARLDAMADEERERAEALRGAEGPAAKEARERAEALERESLEVNADLEAYGAEFDPTAPLEDRRTQRDGIKVLRGPRTAIPGEGIVDADHATEEQAQAQQPDPVVQPSEADKDGDRRDDETGRFVTPPTAEAIELMTNAELEKAIRDAGGEPPKGANKAALRAKLTYLIANPPEA